MSSYQIVVDRTSAGMRLDLYLARRLCAVAKQRGISRAGIQRLIVAGQVTLNGQKAKSSVRLKGNDRVQVEDLPSRVLSLEPEALPLEILYEDQDCLVINKAPGMVVHPAAGRSRGTLVNALLHYCPDLEGIGGERRPGIVHRLDKDTSGAMIVAKNIFAFQQLARQFKERSVNKEYLALAWGKLEPAKGIIDRPIGRHRSDRKRMSSLHPLAKRRGAITEWRVDRHFAIHPELSNSRWVSLLKLKPHTGRTHQIRVHLADLGYPLVGDKIYGCQRRREATKNRDDSYLEAFPRQALHAERLGIRHVRTGQPLEFHAPFPDDIRILLRTLEKQSKGLEMSLKRVRG